MGSYAMTMNPGFAFILYLLVGLAFYFWSEPYRPKSAAAFEHCFRANKFVWVVMVLIASSLWPVLCTNMAYRYFAPRRKDRDESS